MKAFVVLTNISFFLTTLAGASITALFESVEGDSAYTGESYGSLSQPGVRSGGPTGNYYELQPADVGLLSTTLNFDPSGTNTSALRAQFDFRMTSDNGQVRGDGFGFSIYSVSAYGDFAPPEDFTQLDVNNEVVTWEQPRWNTAFSVGFDLRDAALETQDNMVTINADGRRVAEYLSDSDLNDSVWHRVELELANSGDDALASLTLIRDVHGNPVIENVFQDELVAGYFIPGSELDANAPVDWGVAFGGRTGGATVGVDLDNIMVVAIPEPSAVPLILLGFTVLGSRRRGHVGRAS